MAIAYEGNIKTGLVQEPFLFYPQFVAKVELHGQK